MSLYSLCFLNVFTIIRAIGEHLNHLVLFSCVLLVDILKHKVWDLSFVSLGLQRGTAIRNELYKLGFIIALLSFPYKTVIKRVA
jgi:hypothetical protein